MTPLKYVIVGAEVDETKHYVKPDGTVTAAAGPGHVPLNVEYIGKLMVTLSQLGKAAVPAADLARYEAQVKNALCVRPLGEPDNRLTARKKQEILDNTTVSIEFETRTVPQAPATTDLNKRILVVPSDDTLKLKEAEFLADEGSAGFDPPLSYDLDRKLMLASLEKTVLDIFNGFAPQLQLSDEVKAKFQAHVAAEIKRRITGLVGGGGPADSVVNQILNSPVRAFHRSVGIYATNMCR
jgi:hypothetical protein